MKLSTSFFAFLAICLFVPLLGFGQAVGDYQTAVGGAKNWSVATNWARWNGSTWITNPTEGYPGQGTGTGKVSILSGSVILDVAVPNPIGELDITSGAGANGVRFDDNNLTNSLTVTGDITIADGKTLGFRSTTGGNTSIHTLTIGGNLINNGTFDMNGADDIEVTFNGTSNQTISDDGASLTDFNLININNTGAAGNNIVEITTSDLTSIANFLTLTDGIFKLSGTFTFSKQFFLDAAYTIPAGSGIWLNNSNVSALNQGSAIILDGLLRVTLGTYSVGNGVNKDISYGDGAELTMEGGTLDISGFLHGSATTNNITFTMSGGIITLGTTPGSFNNTYSVFDIRNIGSTFTMSGGSIVLQNANFGVGNANGYRNAASTFIITGGTLQFGNSLTNGGNKDDFVIADGTVCPSISIVDNATSVPTVTILNPINVYGNITINTGTSLLGNNKSIYLYGNSTALGNWTNDGTFTPGNAGVIFGSTFGVQTIGGTTSTTFYNADVNGLGVSLGINTNIDNFLALTSNNATLNNFNLTLNNAAGLPGGGSSSSYIVTNGNGRFIRTIGGVGTYDFPLGTSTAYNPATMTWGGAPGATELSSRFVSTQLTGPDPFTSTVYGGSEPTTITTFLDNGYWDFTTPSSINSYTLTLVAEAVNNLGLNDSFHSIFQNIIPEDDGFNWDDAGTSPIPNFISGTSISLQMSGVSGVGYFGIGRSDEYILPIVLVNFDGSNVGNANVLSWTTATELNNDYFTIERSLDGKSYEEIGTVEGAGQSSALLNYEYTDAQPYLGTNYYRLKQTDYNGAFDYSNVISIKVNGNFEMGYPYPNPVVNNVS
ncbi:MAG: hypothetical protein WAT52_00780, partial [Chitinophagales bacterium]